MGNYANGAPQALLDYLSYMQTIKGKSPNTAQVYFYDLRLFMRFIADRFELAGRDDSDPDAGMARVGVDELSRVTLSDLYAFMSYVSRERGNESRARARKVATLKSFFGYLHAKAKAIPTNPTTELESPKTVKRLPRHLGLDESRQLLSAADSDPDENGWRRERNYAITALFLNCGMRLSELVGINVSNMRSDTLTIVGKGDKERTVYLNDASQNAIKAYLDVRPPMPASAPPEDRDALFVSSRRVRISRNMVQRIVKRHLALAGLDTQKYSAHKLRHTAATLMYQHGHVDIRSLQAILGHASIATTEIYTHLDSRQLKDAVDRNPLSAFRPRRA